MFCGQVAATTHAHCHVGEPPFRRAMRNGQGTGKRETVRPDGTSCIKDSDRLFVDLISSRAVGILRKCWVHQGLSQNSGDNSGMVAVQVSLMAIVRCTDQLGRSNHRGTTLSAEKHSYGYGKIRHRHSKK